MSALSCTGHEDDRWSKKAFTGTGSAFSQTRRSGLRRAGGPYRQDGGGSRHAPCLQDGQVERWQWLTSNQLLDAVAIGQVTPGPVFTTATFIGYLLAGHLGALMATVGIFLPSFILVMAVNPWIPKLRRSQWASGFLDGVNVASLGLMAVVTWKLATTVMLD